MEKLEEIARVVSMSRIFREARVRCKDHGCDMTKFATTFVDAQGLPRNDDLDIVVSSDASDWIVVR